MLNGILNIDKPRGMTSHDVVAAVRRIIGLRAVGHTGSLDPDASGVLLLCLGRATKLARVFEELDKSYWVVMCLGVCTDTQDATGTVTRQRDVPPLSILHLQEVLQQYTGAIAQIPPMYSAVKYHGQRLYRLARQGHVVQREARHVVIHRLELLDLRGPLVTLAVTCSKGTYIRTLCEDIGLTLGYGAHVVHLQRCRIGRLSLRQAWSLELLRQEAQAGRVTHLCLPLPEALAFLPALSLTPHQYDLLCTGQGRALTAFIDSMACRPLYASWYRLCTPAKQTVAVMGRHTTRPHEWKVYPLEHDALQHV
jgi:tRNA pseudouridine55 synthase